MASTLIRRVESTDSAVIREVRLRALATDPSSFGSTYEREAMFPDAIWAEWASGDADGEEMATLLAIRGDKAVGIVAAVSR